MSSTDLRLIMSSHTKILEVCNDPDLDSDSKLFAVLMLTLIYQRKVAGRRSIKNRSTLHAVAQMCGHKNPHWWIRRVIQNDIPRYEPPPVAETGCLAPMIQREGPCGKRAIKSGWDRDPLTGVAIRYAFCSRHLNHADDCRIQQNIRQWIENDQPSPPPNKGGVLRKYFDSDWNSLYKWAAPYEIPLDGAEPPTLPKPALTLIRGGPS
ncbi:hypothetical protein [Mycobacterium marinum]|uniref:hypothetical protein n=1 Tax=Mycobacterium marinum TaxID=1781 RepID=UPI00115E7659|nr:hypothetical protein [Mycobacterium marinum]